jgi:HEPN domain-containing protein
MKSHQAKQLTKKEKGVMIADYLELTPVESFTEGFKLGLGHLANLESEKHSLLSLIEKDKKDLRFTKPSTTASHETIEKNIQNLMKASVFQKDSAATYKNWLPVGVINPDDLQRAIGSVLQKIGLFRITATGGATGVFISIEATRKLWKEALQRHADHIPPETASQKLMEEVIKLRKISTDMLDDAYGVADDAFALLADDLYVLFGDDVLAEAVRHIPSTVSGLADDVVGLFGLADDFLAGAAAAGVPIATIAFSGFREFRLLKRGMTDPGTAFKHVAIDATTHAVGAAWGTFLVPIPVVGTVLGGLIGGWVGFRIRHANRRLLEEEYKRLFEKANRDLGTKSRDLANSLAEISEIHQKYLEVHIKNVPGYSLRQLQVLTKELRDLLLKSALTTQQKLFALSREVDFVSLPNSLSAVTPSELKHEIEINLRALNDYISELKTLDLARDNVQTNLEKIMNPAVNLIKDDLDIELTSAQSAFLKEIDEYQVTLAVWTQVSVDLINTYTLQLAKHLHDRLPKYLDIRTKYGSVINECVSKLNAEYKKLGVRVKIGG